MAAMVSSAEVIEMNGCSIMMSCNQALEKYLKQAFAGVFFERK
jgi:hypothetical protein